jgi:uncharacterized protein YprB with RNaseH-like and TPR domain
VSNVYVCSFRNHQKRAKTARHEAEKAHMEDRRGLGIATGQYQGNGQGEEDTSDQEDNPVYTDMEDVNSEDDDETVMDANKFPLLFFFDIETTGFQIYDDTITDIAGKVVDIPPNLVSQPTYTSLVMTNRAIPERGMKGRLCST